MPHRTLFDKFLGRGRILPITPEVVTAKALDESSRSTISGLSFELERERGLARTAIARVQMKLAEGALTLVRSGK